MSRKTVLGVSLLVIFLAIAATAYGFNSIIAIECNGEPSCTEQAGTNVQLVAIAQAAAVPESNLFWVKLYRYSDDAQIGYQDCSNSPKFCTLEKHHTETVPGTYTYYAQALDDQGYLSNEDKVLTVTATFLNNPPGAPDVDVTPNNPVTGDNLDCTVIQAATDIDGDIVQYKYEWYRGDDLFSTVAPTTETTSRIESSNTAKGETWKCVVTSFDGEDDGGSDWDSVEIGNTAPEVGSASLGPTDAYTDTLFTCTGSGAFDPDTADSLTHYYLFRDTGGEWGWSTDNTFSCDTLGCDKGDTISCQYKVNDGTIDSNIVISNGVEIQNSLPTVDSVSFGEGEVYKASTLTAISNGANDKDQDSLTYWYQFRDTDDTTVLQDWSQTNTFDCSASAGCEAGDTIYVYHKVNDGETPGDSNTVSASKDISNQLPIANAGGPYSFAEGTEITFDGSGSSDPEGPLALYEWDFNYNGVDFDVDATGVAPKNTWYDDYSATVALRVTDSFGDTDIATASLTVVNVNPVVTQVTNTGPVSEGVPVNVTINFNDPGTDDTFTFLFDWYNNGTFLPGDSTTEHIYLDNSTYIVNVKVVDDNGGEGTGATDVRVEDLGPTASFTFPSTVEEGVEVQFTDTSSSYPDGITDWYWQFGDGGTNTSQNATHTFMDQGAWSVTLTVTDEDGSTHPYTDYITVTDRGPTAHFTYNPTSPVEGQPVQFNDNSSSYPDDLQTWNWSFGDGGTSDAPNPPYTFQASGEFNVTLTVTDDDGTPGIYIERVTVGDTGPTASFTFNPTDPEEGEVIQFNDTSTAHDGVVGWYWEFGDGSNSTEKDPTHAYSDNGAYTVNLTVTDGDGTPSSASGAVTVTNLDPLINTIIFDPDPGVEGILVNVTVDATDPSTVDAASLTYSFSWDGDSTYEVDQSSNIASNAWDTNGTKTVRVKVEDKDGGSAEMQTQIEINDQGPTAAFNFTPQNPNEGQSIAVDASSSISYPDAITKYEWDWEGEGVYDYDDVVPTATSPAYLEDGTFNVTLRVTDEDGSQDIAEMEIVINDIDPTAVLIGPSSLDEGVNGTFNASGSTGDPVDAISLFEWDWDYQAGNFEASGDTGPVQENSFRASGSTETITVAVRVTDEDSSSIATLDVDVADLAPVVDFQWAPLAPNDTETVYFVDHSTSYPDLIESWFWDFGDGTNDTNQDTSHLFANGTWTVTLIVTDEDGSTNNTSRDITVSHLNIPPTQPNLSPLTGVFGGDLNPVHVVCSGSTDPNGDEVYYSIDAYFDGGWTSLLYQERPGVVDWDVSGLTTQSGVQIRCNATDLLEDSPYTYSGSLSIDNDAPSTTSNFTSTDWQTAAQTIELTAVDVGDAGVDTTLYCVDQADTCTPDTATASFEVATEGTNYLRFHSNDTVGNVETVSSQVVKIDTSGPAFSNLAAVPGDLDEHSTGDVSISASITDTHSGLNTSTPALYYRYNDSMAYQTASLTNTGGDTWEGVIPEPTGSWSAQQGNTMSWYVEAEDLVGNLASSTVKSDLISEINDAPVVDFSGLVLSVAEDEFDDSTDLNSYVVDESLATLTWACSSNVTDLVVTVFSDHYLNVSATNNFNGAVEVTCTATDDGELDGTDSFELTVTAVNDAPTHDYPVLNSTSGGNNTNDDLVCWTQNTDDVEGDPVKNIYSWYKNGLVTTDLNMPFEGGSNSTWTKDYSGNGNDGAVSGATWNPTGGHDGFGAYGFDGEDDYISVGNHTSLKSQQFTVMAWMYHKNKANSRQSILGDSNYAGGNFTAGYTMRFWESSTTIRCILGDPSAYSYEIPVTVEPETWTHVAMSFDGTTFSAYKNGTLVGSKPASYTPSDLDLWIGRDWTNPNDVFFNGSIDDVQVFSHALSAEQIETIYQGKDNTIDSQETSIGDEWTCSVTPNDGTEDGQLKASNTLNIINHAPVLAAIEDQTAFRSQRFYLDLGGYASDVDQGDILTFTADTAIPGFNMSSEGVINFVPDNSSLGEGQLVTITVSDGDKNDSKSFLMDIYIAHDSELGAITDDIPTTLYVGDNVTINSTVTNNGHFSDNFTVNLKDGTTVVDSQVIELGPGDSQPVSFTWTPSTGGYRTVSIEVEAVPMEDDVTNNIQYLDNVRVWSAEEVIDTGQFQLEFSQNPVSTTSPFQLRFKLVNSHVDQAFEDFPVRLDVPNGVTLTGDAQKYYNLPAGYNAYVYRNLTAGSISGNYTITLVGGNDEVIDTAVIEVV